MKRLRLNLKKLRALSENNDIELWSLDECHFQQHGSRCMMWVPPEDIDPIVLHEPTRKHISVFGAVCIEKGNLVTQFSKVFNGSTFQEYPEMLLTHKSDSCCMHIILDNSRYHHALLCSRGWKNITRRYNWIFCRHIVLNSIPLNEFGN